MKRLLNVLGIFLCLLTLVALCGSALAYFSTTGNGTAAAAVTSLTAPTLTATPEAGGKVKLSWTASTAPGAGTVTYYVERDGGEPGSACPTKASPAAVTSCTDAPVAIGSHTYRVTAIYKTWTRQSAVANANVTVGVVTQFALTAATTTPTAGAEDALTITAQDEKGSTVTTFAGSKSLVFSGAPLGPTGTKPTVTPSTSTTGVEFGAATAITFTAGIAKASSGKNGAMKIYKAGEASINVSEGSITDPTPLVITVAPAAASKFTVAAATSAPAAGAEDNLTITAFDTYGNVATGYTGSHGLVYSGASNSPGGNVPTATDSTGAKVNFGTSTPVVFTAGVAASGEGKNGGVTLYNAAASAVKVAEGAINGTVSPSITPVAGATASLKMTTSNAAPSPGASVTLTITPIDAYGNTATTYTGEKKFTFSGATASPSGQQPTANGVAFGTQSTITFAGAAKAVTMVLYRAGTSTITATDGTFTSAGVAETVATGTASKLAFLNLTATPGTVSTTCFFTCSVTGVGFGGQVKANLQVTDTYGNPISNYGASKTATVSSSPTGPSIEGSSLTFAETGAAVTTAQFTFTYPGSGTTTYTIKTTSTGLTEATATVAK